MCRIITCEPVSHALPHARQLSSYSLDDSNSDRQTGGAHELVTLVADCISVVLSQFEDLGFSEEDALQVAAGYIAEVVPVLQVGPWPASAVASIPLATSRIELEAAAEKLRKLGAS